jgi:hypothetical protein
LSHQTGKIASPRAHLLSDFRVRVVEYAASRGFLA